jgi:cell division protein FtsQ
MNKTRKLLLISGYGAIALAVVVLLVYVVQLRNSATCEALVVVFPESACGFVTEAELRQRIAASDELVVGEPLYDIDLKAIEKTLVTLPQLKEVYVYRTIDRQLVVEIEERKAFVRLIDKYGKQAIIDSEGYLMPVPVRAVPRIPVISLGFELAQKEVNTCVNISESNSSELLLSVFHYALVVEDDPFLKAQFQHTLLRSDGEFVVYPQVGNHTISIGTLDNLEEKIDNLKLFYSDGMNAVNWNKFADINLKYKDQIVCTKK